jgi:hypothetical protein
MGQGHSLPGLASIQDIVCCDQDRVGNETSRGLLCTRGRAHPATAASDARLCRAGSMTVLSPSPSSPSKMRNLSPIKTHPSRTETSLIEDGPVMKRDDKTGGLFGEAVWKSGFLSIRTENSGRVLAYFENAEASSLNTFRNELAQSSPVSLIPLGACDVKCGAPYKVTSLADPHTTVSQSALSHIRTYLKCANLHR